MFGAFERVNDIVIVTEYLDGGELFDRIVDEDQDLTESDCSSYMKQVCLGLDYLHNLNIVHLDIKVRKLKFLFNLQQTFFSQRILS